MGCVCVNLSSSDDSSKKCPCVWWKWKLYLSQNRSGLKHLKQQFIHVPRKLLYIQPLSSMSCAIYICFKDAWQRPYDLQPLNSRKSSKFPLTILTFINKVWDVWPIHAMPKMWRAKAWVYSLRNGLWLANFCDKSDGHKPQFGSTEPRCSTSFLGAKRHPEYFILATQGWSGGLFSAINSSDLHQDLCPDCFLQVQHQWTGSPG